jgi:hypothetical protein
VKRHVKIWKCETAFRSHIEWREREREEREEREREREAAFEPGSTVIVV